MPTRCSGSCFLSLVRVCVLPAPPFCSCNLFVEETGSFVLCRSPVCILLIAFRGGVKHAFLVCFFKLIFASRSLMFLCIEYFIALCVLQESHNVVIFLFDVSAIDDHCLEPLFHYGFARW